jgi:hypothetical protein
MGTSQILAIEERIQQARIARSRYLASLLASGLAAIGRGASATVAILRTRARHGVFTFDA